MQQFESSDEAAACRSALHGTTWPSSNPKTLRVEFAELNEVRRRRMSKNDGSDELIGHLVCS